MRYRVAANAAILAIAVFMVIGKASGQGTRATAVEQLDAAVAAKGAEYVRLRGTIIEMGRDAEPYLETAAKDKALVRRAVAAAILARMRYPDTQKGFEVTLRRNVQTMRMSRLPAFKALSVDALLGVPAALPFLLETVLKESVLDLPGERHPFKDYSLLAQCCAAAQLGRFHEPDVTELLLGVLDADARPELRAASAMALGDLKETRAVDPLIRALSSGDESLESFAACALGKIGDPRAEPALIDAAARSDGVRYSAELALRSMGAPRNLDELRAKLADENPAVRRRILATLAGLGTAEATDCVADALRSDKDAEVRRHAAMLFGRIKAPRFAEALVAALKDEAWQVREAAILALECLKDQRAIEPLKTIADDKAEKPWVRARAVSALAKLGVAAGGATAADAVRDPDPGVRRAAVWALRTSEAPAATRMLVEALSDKDLKVKETALEALRERRDPAAGPALVALVTNKGEDPFLRGLAAQALAASDGALALRTLTAVVETGDPATVRAAALWPLVRLGSTEALMPVNDALRRDLSPEVRGRAAELLGRVRTADTLDALMDAVQDRDGEVRWRAVKALGERCEARSVPCLVKALKDESGNVRFSAAYALSRITGKDTKSSPEVFMEWWRDRPENRAAVGNGDQ